MKKIISLTFILILLVSSCSKEEPNLELFGAEAFAYTLDNGWELNASVNAKGFQQNEIEDIYSSELYYEVNLTTPEETLSKIDFGTLINSVEEELLDIPIEIQVEIDTGFAVGQYSIEFIVTDNFSTQKDTIAANFVLNAD